MTRRPFLPSFLLPILLQACGGDPAPVDTGAPWRPDLACPGDPSGACDPVEGAPLEAGAAVVPVIPDCFEIWADADGDGSWDEEVDGFLDCGCDRACPEDPGWTGADEGEGDGRFQAAWIAGFGHARPASGVRGAGTGSRGEGDGLWARALLLHQGETTLLVVAYDVVGLFHDRADEISARVAARVPEVDHVLVHATHNHEGPDTMGMWGPSLTETGEDPAYRDQLAEAAAEAAEIAWNARVPVTVEIGAVDLSGLHPDGMANLVRDSRDPWVADETLHAARFVDEAGGTVATLVRWSDHPEALGDDNTLLTSDFVHALRATVEDGVAWEGASRPGTGGPCIYLNGMVGGMMTPLGVTVEDPDGTEHAGDTFEKADALGQILGGAALDALEAAEPMADPALSFRAHHIDLLVENRGFHAMMLLGILDREAHGYDPAATIEEGNLPLITTEVGVVELGSLQILAMPGELFPELVLGGYDGSHVNAPGVEVVDPDNAVPPDLSAAPAGPYLLDRMTGTHRWVVGLANDEIGYVIPAYDFAVDEDFPYLSEAEGHHYEETNSPGPATAAVLETEAARLLAWTP